MRRVLAVLILAAAAGFAPTAPPALPPRAPSPAHDALINAGYEVVPLVCKLSNQYVRVKYKDHELTLLVDTGAGNTMIDEAVALRLKIEASDVGRSSVGFGGSRRVREAMLGNFSIAGADLPPIRCDVADMSEVIKSVRTEDGVESAGVLGAAVLKYLSAVIDTAGDRLYLLDPVKHAKLAGTWVNTATTAGGAPVAVPPGSVVLVMGGGLVRYSNDDGKTFTDRGLLVRGDLGCMDWGPSTGGGLRGLYAVEGDTLTIAMPLFPADDAQTRPGRLLSGPGDKFTTMVFKRRPPAK